MFLCIYLFSFIMHAKRDKTSLNFAWALIHDKGVFQAQSDVWDRGRDR